MSHAIRAVQADDLGPLAKLWHDGWHEAHAAFVPEDLTQRRTPDRFRERIEKLAALSRTVGPVGAPLGFATIKVPEMNQLFVAADARGGGVAAALLADAERRLVDVGVTRSFLLCVIENVRAAAFYEKQGWVAMGVSCEAIETHAGPISFDVLRFEKDLNPVS